jgi:hypothetical protein
MYTKETKRLTDLSAADKEPYLVTRLVKDERCKKAAFTLKNM